MEKTLENNAWVVYKDIFGIRKEIGDSLNAEVIYIPALDKE